jgi:hypothetical protein
MRWPFTIRPDGTIPFVEQDSPQEVEQCVGLVFATPRGGFPDEPALGLAQPTDVQGGISESALDAAARRWEPRAHLNFTSDEMTGIAQTVGIEVSL